ncbi:MAG: DUF924 family protein [Amaricoccus sp.]
MHERAEAILNFWVDEIGPAGWYEPPKGLDETIRARFAADWDEARRGAYDTWICTPRSCLALIILLDQFPRNMFRGEAKAFASDAKALAIAKRAIRDRRDQAIPAPERQFFYLPLMHSENLPNQEKCVRQFLINFGPSNENVTHARAHREVIRRFGRFPYRNDALARRSTSAERAFLDSGGYGAALRAVGTAISA